MAIISPKPKSFKELIQDKYYYVPLYQRPYDWDVDKVSQLWDDIDKNDSGYFLGTVLFKPDQSDDPHPTNFEIVDGQQRFATLLLLLRAAIETLKQIGAEEDANEFQRDYIAQRPAGIKESHPTLVLNKRDKNKFESLLLGESLSGRCVFVSWKNQEKAIEFFRKEFKKLNDDRGKEGIIEFINEKVLKLSFLEILLGTDSDVYQFFETLNDRGMDLSIADLVKNRVCAAAASQHRSVEEGAAIINHISEEVRVGKFKTFLLHYCWANGKDLEPTPRKKLMTWYGEQIDQTRDIRKFLRHLEDAALERYINYVEPSRCHDKAKKSLFIHLDALGATRCYPLLLKGEEYLNRKDFLQLCNAVEVLTFRHSTILKRDAKSLEGFFYELIRNIRNKKPIKDMLEKFRQQPAIKANDLFKLAFTEFVPATHKLARYTLWKIEEVVAGKKQATLDWDNLTLEHILAERLDWAGREEYLQRLGNLTLLSFKMNDEAANKPFKIKKKKIYEKEKRIKITKDLTKFTDFRKDTIISRQKDLAEIAVRVWSAKRII